MNAGANSIPSTWNTSSNAGAVQPWVWSRTSYSVPPQSVDRINRLVWKGVPLERAVAFSQRLERRRAK